MPVRDETNHRAEHWVLRGAITECRCGLAQAIAEFEKEETNENPINKLSHDLLHYLCTGEVSQTLKDSGFPFVVSYPPMFGPPEPSHRPATLGTDTRREGA